MPKVSIVIPTYNKAKYLPEAIESVLNQTYQDIDIIIIDDGSNDNTKEIICKYIQEFSGKIKYYSQKNQGPAAARNRGIREAKSDFISFLDSDDLYIQDYLEQCIKYINDNGFDLIMTDNYYELYDENGKCLKKEYRTRENYKGNENKLYEILFSRFQNGFSGDMRILIKKACFHDIGFFDENLHILEDWDLWLRIAKNNLKVGYINRPLFVYRRFVESICRNRNNDMLKLRNIYYAFEKNKKDAFRINYKLINSYKQTLWMLGTNSIVNKLGLFFGIKCLIKSKLAFLLPNN